MRYDLLIGRKSKDKTYWTNIGSAFSRDNGGFSLVFNALPIPDETGKVGVLMVEPKEKSNQVIKEAIGSISDLDDSIPFD